MIQLPSTITKIESLLDNTIRIRVETQEVSSDAAVELFNLRGKLGWMVFSADSLTPSDIPKEKPNDMDTKTPGQRLRAVLYVTWEQNGKKGDFETFYRSSIERIIEKYKEKLT